MTKYEEYRKDNPGVSWEKYVDTRFDNIDKAIALSHGELNRRLEGMNEIRSQLDRQAAGFITREAVEAMLEAQSNRLQALERAAIGAALSVVIAIVVWILT